jgi:pimeloyl-ACP methyl ester carboxylesterase
MNELTIPQGRIRYREAGTGAPIVLVHGLLVNGDLWKDVIPRLAQDFRVIVPDLPLGSHELPMKPGTDLSPLGLAGIIEAFLAGLGLEDVTLVGNDTGGALCQLVVVHHPERIGRLVLTPCDAFENFPPPMFRPLLTAARIPGAVYAIAQSLRPRPARRLPFAYGWLSKHGIPDELTDAWMAPTLRSREIRREVAAVLKGMSKDILLAASARLGDFRKPVLLAWAPEDRFFKFHYAERLAGVFADARLEPIEDSYTFVSIDQPERTAELIAAFAREPVPTQ